jgi:hypothetical protein
MFLLILPKQLSLVVLAVVQLHVEEQDFFFAIIFVLEGSHVFVDFVEAFIISGACINILVG